MRRRTRTTLTAVKYALAVALALAGGCDWGSGGWIPRLDTTGESCTPQCDGRTCGDDGCGGTCGECGPSQYCAPWGQCSLGLELPFGLHLGPEDNCRSYHDCLESCEAWDGGCPEACATALSGVAELKASALDACLATECTECRDEADPVACSSACAQAECTVPMAECWFAHGPGECPWHLNCLADDTLDDDLCYDDLSAVGFLGALALTDCLELTCGLCAVENPTPEQQEACDACRTSALQNACLPQAQDCYGACQPDCSVRACGTDPDCPMSACGTCADGDEIYVSTGGDDLAGDGTIGAPYRTIQFVLNEVAEAGDTLVLRGGTYNEAVRIATPQITIRSMANEWATIQCPVDDPDMEVAVWFRASPERASGGRLQP